MCRQAARVSPGQSAAFPGPQSTGLLLLLPLRGNELRATGTSSRTSRQQNQENRHSGAMMEGGREGGAETDGVKKQTKADREMKR